MASYTGEFPSTIDAKGRFLLPAGLKKLIPVKEQKEFVVHRGIEKHLEMFTRKEWEKESEAVNKLNQYVKKNRDFIRIFNRGATVIALDPNNRLLIPKSLLDYASIDKDIVLFTYSNRIEIWSQAEFDRMMKDNSIDYSKLAEDVMGNKNPDDSRVS
jgi:MraZ protein